MKHLKTLMLAVVAVPACMVIFTGILAYSLFEKLIFQPAAE